MTPQAPKELVLRLSEEGFDRYNLDGTPVCWWLAVRGYWPQSMGPTRKNDPGVWDDAMFFVCPSREIFIPQQANTDPSRYGWNSGAGKPMAVLNTGLWFFRRGAHKGKTPAFRQLTPEEARAHNAAKKKHLVPNDGRFSVTRTYAEGDKRNYVEAGYYAINIHPGGINGTSSEGCQTVPRAVATNFLQKCWDTSLTSMIDAIPYLLVDGPIN